MLCTQRAHCRHGHWLCGLASADERMSAWSLVRVEKTLSCGGTRNGYIIIIIIIALKGDQLMIRYEIHTALPRCHV